MISNRGSRSHTLLSRRSERWNPPIGRIDDQRGPVIEGQVQASAPLNTTASAGEVSLPPAQVVPVRTSLNFTMHFV